MGCIQTPGMKPAHQLCLLKETRQQTESEDYLMKHAFSITTMLLQPANTFIRPAVLSIIFPESSKIRRTLHYPEITETSQLDVCAVFWQVCFILT
jgi:hypothetical protein